MNNKYLTLWLFVILCLFKPAFANDSALSVENSWIAEAPPVSRVMVAYMWLKNSGEASVEVISARSDTYSSIEFHETVHENGLARMIRHDRLTIPSGETLKLKRGGAHLMLFNPTKRLKDGDTVTIELTMSNNEQLSIAVPVKKAQF